MKSVKCWWRGLQQKITTMLVRCDPPTAVWQNWDGIGMDPNMVIYSSPTQSCITIIISHFP